MNRTSLILLSVICALLGMYLGMLLSGSLLDADDFVAGLLIAILLGMICFSWGKKR